MRQLTRLLIIALLLVKCKGHNGIQDQLLSKLPYDTVFEFTDSLSIIKIRETDNYLEFLTKTALSQTTGEFYVKESNNKLRKVRGDDFSVNWTQWYTLEKDKENRILIINYNCDTSQNIGYGQDYFFKENGDLFLIINNSAWVSSDYSNAIQEEIRYYFGTERKLIKKTYDLYNQNKEKLSKKDNIFLHSPFPIYWTSMDFKDYYKIKN